MYLIFLSKDLLPKPPLSKYTSLTNNCLVFQIWILNDMARLLDKNEWMKAKFCTIIQFHQNQDQHLQTAFISRAVVVVLLQIHLPFYLLHKVQYIYWDSKLFVPFFYFTDPVFKLVYRLFGQSNLHSALDFCPRPARTETIVPLHIREAKSLQS